MNTTGRDLDPKARAYLDALDARAEFFGFLAPDVPLSFYKVFVRAADAKGWWKFETGAAPTPDDPIAHQARVPVESRTAIVWAPIACFSAYGVHPERAGLLALAARAAAILDALAPK